MNIKAIIGIFYQVSFIFNRSFHLSFIWVGDWMVEMESRRVSLFTIFQKIRPKLWINLTYPGWQTENSWQWMLRRREGSKNLGRLKCQPWALIHSLRKLNLLLLMPDHNHTLNELAQNTENFVNASMEIKIMGQ